MAARNEEELQFRQALLVTSATTSTATSPPTTTAAETTTATRAATTTTTMESTTDSSVLNAAKAENIPATGGEIPAAAPGIPIPATSGELPAATARIPNPATSGELPAAAGIPTTGGELPATAGEIPATGGEIPIPGTEVLTVAELSGGSTLANHPLLAVLPNVIRLIDLIKNFPMPGLGLATSFAGLADENAKEKSLQDGELLDDNDAGIRTTLPTTKQPDRRQEGCKIVCIARGSGCHRVCPQVQDQDLDNDEEW